MREILFRGKRIDNGEWIEGSYLGDESVILKNSYILIVDPNAILGFITHAIDPSTIGQYTGLTDKNGKKIFEGDIVKVSSSGSSYYAKIEYDCGCYWISNPDIQIPDTIDYFNMEFVDVIGNIHDNPELLEDKP